MFDLRKLKTKARNPRKIGEAEMDRLKKSVSEFSNMLTLRPIVYDPETMEVLGGNQRLAALKKLKYTEVPEDWVRSADGLTDEEKRRFVITDNAMFGDWDSGILVEDWDFSEIQNWGVEIDLRDGGIDGFGQGDNSLNGTDVEEDDFEVPQIDEIKTDILPGDMLEIGPHRLLCGDATKVEDVVRLVDGRGEIDMVLTDPPYGVAYVGKTKRALTIKNDNMTDEQTHNLWASALSALWGKLKDGGAIYATVPAGRLQLGFMKVMEDLECLRQVMVWNKGSMVLGHSDYHYKHEPILYGWKPGAAHFFTSDRTQTTVFDFDKPQRNAEHPTMKPVGLWAKMIVNSTLAGWSVYDPFSGSGTTMVACEGSGRIAYCMEIDPKYCQVIVDRMTSLNPSLEIRRNGELYVNGQENGCKEAKSEAPSAVN